MAEEFQREQRVLDGRTRRDPPEKKRCWDFRSTALRGLEKMVYWEEDAEDVALQPDYEYLKDVCVCVCVSMHPQKKEKTMKTTTCTCAASVCLSLCVLHQL